MNEGVKILLERMKTNPEEFIAESNYGATKWGTLLQEYRPYLDKEDLEVFDAAHKETIFVIMKQRFTEAVMKELLAPEEEVSDEEWNPFNSAPVKREGSTVTYNAKNRYKWVKNPKSELGLTLVNMGGEE